MGGFRGRKEKKEMNNLIILEPKKNKRITHERKVNRDHILFLQHSHPVGSRDLQKNQYQAIIPNETMHLGPHYVNVDTTSPLLDCPLAVSCLESYLKYDIREEKLWSSCIVGKKNLFSIKTKKEK